MSGDEINTSPMLLDKLQSETVDEASDSRARVTQREGLTARHGK